MHPVGKIHIGHRDRGGISLIQQGENHRLPVTACEGKRCIAEIFLAVRSVGQGSIAAPQFGQLTDDMEQPAGCIPLLHHRAVVGILPAMGVVHQVLLGAIKEGRNSPQGE